MSEIGTKNSSIDRPQLIRTGIAYLYSGLSVIPVGQNKKPLVNWKRNQNQAMDEAALRRFLKKPQATGVAAICGEVSGNLLILDFDIPRFYDLWLEKVGTLAGELPTQRTGNGYQVALRCDIPGRNTVLAWAANEQMRDGREVAIETRGEGGYALLPPSLHPNGNRYEALSGDFTAIPHLQMDTVNNLLEAARALDEVPLTRREMLQQSLKSDDWKASLNGQGSVIDTFNGAFSIRETLERNGYERGSGNRYRRPGGKSASVSILDERFSYHFSTNDPLSGPHRHDSFSVYCLLEHDGDVKEAVRAAAHLLGMPHATQSTVPDSQIDEERGFSPFSRIQASPFPVDVFPSPLRRLVEEGAKAIFCPVDFLAVPLLVLAGAAIGTSRALQIKPGWCEGPRIYAAIVADPGSKKSPALELVFSPFKKRQQEKQAEYQQALEDYRKDRGGYEIAEGVWRKKISQQQATAEDMPREPQEPQMEQVFTTDSTLEALAALLERNQRGLLFYRDELAGWVLGMNQYKSGHGTDRQAWLSFWNGAQVVVNRKNRKGPLVLNNPFVSVVGAIPPEMLTDFMDERGREDGFIHRILFAYPQRMNPKWTDENVGDDILNAVESIFDRLWVLEPEKDDMGNLVPKAVRFTGEGRRRWVAWITVHYAELDRPDFEENLRGPWSKMEGYCARLALILHECRVASSEANEEGVDEISVDSAARLIDYFKGQTRQVYAQLRVTPEDKKIISALKWIERHDSQATVRDIVRSGVAGLKQSHEAKQLFNQLEDRGYGTVKEKDSPHGGRKSLCFILHAKESDTRQF